MLIQSLVLPIFVIALFFIVIFSIAAIAASRMLERMPNNGNEENTKKSWTRPERASYIAITFTWILFAVSSFLLASAETIVVILSIGLITLCLFIPATNFILAFAVMHTKQQQNKNLLADHNNNGRHYLF
jgi:hypothetical protein